MELDLILPLPLLSGAIISDGGGATASGQISAEGVIRQLRAIGKQKVRPACLAALEADPTSSSAPRPTALQLCAISVPASVTLG